MVQSVVFTNRNQSTPMGFREFFSRGSPPSAFTPSGGGVEGFGGRLGGGISQRQQQQEEEQHQQEQARLKELLTKSEKQLLTPKERIELQQLSVPVGASRTTPTVNIRAMALSPLERFRLKQKQELDSRTMDLETKQAQLDVLGQELQNRFKVLHKQGSTGVLQAGVVAKFNADVQAYNKGIEGLNQQRLQQQGAISGFQTAKTEKVISQTKTNSLPKTALEFGKSGILQELEARKPKPTKALIEPPMGLPEIKQRIFETGKSTGEFGKASFQRAGLPFLASGGEIVGGGIGLGLGAVEAVPAAAFDRALFELEKRQGRPAELRLRKESIEEAGVKFFAGIPLLGEITGAKQAVTPTGVKITRPVIREAATTAFLLGAPEIAKIGGAGIRTVSKASKAEGLFVKSPKGAVIEEVSVKVVGGKLVPQRTTVLLGKISEKDVLFGLPKPRQPSLMFQTRAALKEVKDIVGKQPQKPITVFERPFKMQRGQVVLQEPMPFSVGDISKREAFFSKVKLGQRGQIGLGGTRTLEIETPRTRYKGIEFYDPYERLLERGRIVSPAFQRGFKLPAEARLESVLERSLGATQARQVSGLFGAQLTGLKSFEQSLLLPKARLGSSAFSRMAEREAEATKTASMSGTKSLTGLKSMEKLLTLQRTSQAQRTKRATGFRERERFKTKQKAKPFFFQLPILKPLQVDPFFGTGFEVFVKRKGRFEKVSKEVLTEKSARGLGQLITTQTPARSFFIRPTFGKAKAIREYENANLGEQFRRPIGKTKLPAQAFVEKSKYAINRPLELLGITRKGQAAKRAKSKKSRGLF